nr:P1 [Tobacco polerovirus 2]
MNIMKLFVLFVFFFLSSSATTIPSWQGIPRTGTADGNLTVSPGSRFTVESESLSEKLLPPQPIFALKQRAASENREIEFNEVLHLLWHVILRDCRLLFSTAQQIFKNFCESGLTTAKAWLIGAFGACLWALISIWSSCIWVVISWIYFLVTTYTMYVACIALLYALTAFMVKALLWTFSGWPTSLALFIYKTGKNTYTALSYKKSYVEEKQVKGFISLKIPQQPPKSCILEVQYEDNSHAGYASCVRLFDGTLGLMTARHVVDAGSKVASVKNTNKIPLSQFTPLITSNKGDFILLSGPPNWESLLACKGVAFVPASQLSKSKMRFYFMEKGEWMADHGEVVGPRDAHMAATLCNSEAGYSGTPIFNGKMIIGVHIGADNDFNQNLMATIPPVSGLTTPQYVFETTAPQGRVFNDEDIEVMLKSITVGIPKLQDFKSITGKNWADYEDDDFSVEVKPPPSKAQSEEEAGNEKGRAVCQTNSKTGDKVPEASTPPVKPTPFKPTDSLAEEGKCLEQLLTKLVERIDLSSIEKKVVEVLADKAMKKPQRSQRRRRPQKASNDTLQANTNGRYQPPHKRSQGSKGVEPSPATTNQNKSKVVSGAPSSSKNTQSWVKKSPASAGRQ